jgi:hypothetical protein
MVGGKLEKQVAAVQMKYAVSFLAQGLKKGDTARTKIFAIVSAGIFLIIAAVSVLYVQETDRSYIGKISLAKTVATEPT